MAEIRLKHRDDDKKKNRGEVWSRTCFSITVLFSLIASTAAGLFALRERRTWREAPFWFFPPLLVAIHRFFLDWPYPTLQLNYVLLLVAAAVLTRLLLHPQRFNHHQLVAAVTLVAFVILACWSFLHGTKQANFDTAVHHAELDDSWREQGVDYLILKAATKFPPSDPPVYQNARYAVYRLGPGRSYRANCLQWTLVLP